MSNEQKEWSDEIEGCRVECVQSILHRGGRLAAFTIRFADGVLLKVDAFGSDGAIDVKVVVED